MPTLSTAFAGQESESTVSLKEWIELGCFGVLAFIVVYERWYVFPKAFDAHERMATTLIDGFRQSLIALVDSAKEEATASRLERHQSAEIHKAERNADRLSRHEQAQILQQIVGEIYVSKDKP